MPGTNFLLARDQGGARRPEYELNAQLQPCTQDDTLRPNWGQNDDYQLDLWLDGNTIRYRDPRRTPGVNAWSHTHQVTQPDSANGRGTEATCQKQYTDVWNDAGSLYALDTGHRLIRAFNLDQQGTTYTPDPGRDIPLHQDHYRSAWEIQGIWGDADHIWVSAAKTDDETGHYLAAYRRADFTRNTGADIDLSAEAYAGFRRVWDIHPQGDLFWTIDNDHQEQVFGRDKDNLADTRTCPGSQTENRMANSSTQGALRVTGQAQLLYTLNFNTQVINTYSTGDCPPTDVDSEFEYRDIENKPAQEPTGISTDDGRIMYFSFPNGEIRHIAKIFPNLVGTDHTITIPENTQGVRDQGAHLVGKAFRLQQEQAGAYQWFLEDPRDSAKRTACGNTPDPANTSDARHFDCRAAGSRNQTLQLLTRPDHWFDHEAKSAYVFTPRVRDIDTDEVTVRVTINLEDVDETPAPPTNVQTQNADQGLRVTWDTVSALANGATPRTTLDRITGYEVERQPQGGQPSTETVTGQSSGSVNLPGLRPDTQYTVRVRAVNGHGGGAWSTSSSQTTPANRPPTISPTRMDINENSPADAQGRVRLATLTAADPDPEDAVAFNALSGTDASSFTMEQTGSGNTRSLFLNHTPDHEAQESYAITASVTSGAGNREQTVETDLSVTVRDLPEPPAAPAPRPSASTGSGGYRSPGRRPPTPDRT